MAEATTSAGAMTTSRRLHVWLMVSLSLAYFSWFCLRVTYHSWDEGLFSCIAQTISWGGVPFREFSAHYFPGFLYWIAGFYRVLGASLFAGRIAVVVAATLIAVCVYVMARQLLPARYAWIAWGWFLVLSGVREWAFPYSNWHTLPWSWAAVVLVWSGWCRDDRRRLCLAGVCSALALWSKLNIGVFNILAIGFWLVCSPQGQRVPSATPTSRARRVAAYGIGVISVIAVVLIYLAAEGVLANYVDRLRTDLPRYAAKGWLGPGAPLQIGWTIATSLPREQMAQFGLWVVLLVFCGVYTAIGQRRWSAIGLIMVSWFGLLYYTGGHWQAATHVHVLGYYVGMISLCLYCSLWCLIRGIVRPSTPHHHRTDALLFLLVLHAWALIGAIHPHWVELPHWRFAVSPWCIVLAWCLYQVEQGVVKVLNNVKDSSAQMVSLRRRLAQSLVTGSVAVLLFTHVLSQGIAVAQEAPLTYWSHPRARIHAKPALAESLTRLVDEMERHLQPGDHIMAVIRYHLLYFFTERRPYGEHYMFTPSSLPVEPTLYGKVVEGLLHPSTKLVVMDPPDLIEEQRPGVTPLETVIHHHFSVVARVSDCTLLVRNADSLAGHSADHTLKPVVERIQALRDAGHWSAAIDAVELAWRDHPHNAELWSVWASARAHQVMKIYRRTAQPSVLQQWRQHLTASMLLELGYPQEAEPLFRAAVQPDPGLADAYEYMVAQGGLVQALIRQTPSWSLGSALREAIRVGPAAPPFFARRLALRVAAEGHHAEAIEALSVAIEHFPHDDQLWFRVGLAYARLGWYTDALSAFTQAIRLNPTSAEAHYNRAVAVALLPEPQLEDAQIGLQRALELGYQDTMGFGKILASQVKSSESHE